VAGTNLWEALYNQSPPQSVTQTSSDFQSLPAWFQDYEKGMLKYAASSLPTDPVLYQGNRLADLSNPDTAAKVESSFSPDERAAFQQVRANQGVWQPSMQGALNLTNSAGNTTAPGVVNNYMSPYISNVTDRLATLAGRDLSENILPQLSDTFVSAGQMSGSRMGEFTSRAVRDSMESLLGQQGQLLNQGYQSALGAAQTDLSRQLTAGQQLGALGGLQQQYGLNDAAALQTSGQAQSAKAQAGSDIDYQNFVQQRDWSLRNLGALNAALRGTTAPVDTTAYSSGPVNPAYYGGSPLSAAGALGNILGSLPYRSGGRVDPARHRGALNRLAA
jgi:hypothetical protein